MRKSIGALAEDLKVAMLGLQDSAVKSALGGLLLLLDSMVNNEALNALNAEDLRDFKSFLITAHKCVAMEDAMISKHITGHWRGNTQQAVMKLPIGPAAAQAIRVIALGYE
jgi:hypothetical protein